MRQRINRVDIQGSSARKHQFAVRLRPLPLSEGEGRCLLLRMGAVFAFLAVLALFLPGCTLLPGGDGAVLDRASTVMIAVAKGRAASALQGALETYTRQAGEAAQVDFQIEALSEDQYAAEVSAVLLSGSDRYDLVYLDADSLARWARYRALQPLEAPQDQTGLAPWLTEMRVDGALYGLPVEPDYDVLWVRQDWLEAAGFLLPEDPRQPVTWEWVRSAAAAVHSPPERYGMAVAGHVEEAGYDFAALLPGFDGQILTDAHQVAIEQEGAQRAMAFYASLTTPPAVLLPGATEARRGDVIRALQEGKAAVGIGRLSAAQTLLDCEASPKACTAVTSQPKPALRWLWLPGLGQAGAAVGTLSAWSVPLHAVHSKQAQALAAWLTGEAGARAWAEQGGFPAQRAVWAAPPFQDPVLRSMHARLDWVETHKLPFGRISGDQQARKAIHQAAHAALKGEETPPAALHRAAAAVQQARSRGGWPEREQ